jgi:hypothetical protein
VAENASQTAIAALRVLSRAAAQLELSCDGSTHFVIHPSESGEKIAFSNVLLQKCSPPTFT